MSPMAVYLPGVRDRLTRPRQYASAPASQVVFRKGQGTGATVPYAYSKTKGHWSRREVHQAPVPGPASSGGPAAKDGRLASQNEGDQGEMQRQHPLG